MLVMAATSGYGMLNYIAGTVGIHGMTPEVKVSEEVYTSSDMRESCTILQEWYTIGRYRTIVTVFEGRVSVSSRDENGKVVMLNSGEEYIVEDSKKYTKNYRSGKYRTTVTVFEGKVIASPYDKNGAIEKYGVILTNGQKNSIEGVVAK